VAVVDVVEQVAMVVGRILHRGTGEPVVGRLQFAAVEGPVLGKVLTVGRFAISGRPELLLPGLPGQSLRLTVRADSPQYRQGFVEQAVTVPVPIGTTFDPPIDVGTLLLPADPVNVRGRVVEARNPDTAVAGATVEVLQGGVVTDTTVSGGDGRFRFDDVAVVAPAELRCASVGFATLTLPLRIDFGLLVNDVRVRLAPP
jgi:hypothetical protein